MSTLVLLLITGVGLGALYFLVASGLSLIYGLMHVLNFAHGAFLSLGGLLGWEVGRRVGVYDSDRIGELKSIGFRHSDCCFH